jgi:hypothetical protein
LRFPVNLLVGGMEEEKGFFELVRRVGSRISLNNRIGRGAPPGVPAVPENLEVLGRLSCSAIEEIVYDQFKKPGALSTPGHTQGNSQLYVLLCKIRTRVQDQLLSVLQHGLGCAGDDGTMQNWPFITGCYFAATGDHSANQAFLKAVLEKLPKDQEELDWTADALRDDARLQGWAFALGVVDVLLLVAVGTIVYLKWWG